ncbi:MAG TPA: AMP-binding protein [Kofleriaceae bacterium]|nr:AMP-binding protein [Kofleriaceae bacterium]
MPISDRPVPILATAGPAWLDGFAAITADGGVAVPLSPAYPAEELAWFADDVGADTVVMSDDLAAHGEALARGRRVVRLAELTGQGRTGADPLAGPPAQPALILYTSGTTGKPKGAVLSRGNLVAQTDILARAWAIGPGDRMVHALPLHHLHGLVVALLTAHRAGAHVLLLPRFDAARVIAALEAERATLWMAVPTMYHRLRELTERDTDAADALRGAAERLRLATSGSAALPVGLAGWWRDLHGAIPLERYGMTEIGIALANPLDRSTRRAGSVGWPLPTVEIRLVGDDGADASAGPGELRVRGPSVFGGYWQRPEASASAFAGDWFRTGDLAQRDADGCVRLLGRASIDILKSAGFKISALEIEEVMREHPSVAEVAVIGVPDEALGQRVVAAVIARAGAAPASDELHAFARARLPGYKAPREVILVADFPRTPLGKVQKSELLRSLAGRLATG